MYQKKATPKPEIKVNLNQETVAWFKRAREESLQYTKENYEMCKKLCTNSVEAELEFDLFCNETLNFENYL